MGFIKIGSFRIVSQRSESYMTYDEFRGMDEEGRLRLKEKADSGQVELFCACRAGNENPLMITSLGVIRVSANCRQQDHAESCPKSEGYAGWAAQARKGIAPLGTAPDGDGGRLCFNFSLPPIFPSRSSSSSSSSGTGTGKPREKKVALLELVTSVNRIAWLNQTYSVKKKISQARKEGRKSDWEYKSLDEFNRLFFGTCNDVFVRVSGQTVPLYSLCYRADRYAECQSPSVQFFIYAVVEKVSPFKSSRKYQYVTVRMRNTDGGEKTVIRILTEDFEELFGKGDGGIRVLSGFIRKISYSREDGGSDDWATLVRGVVIHVTANGLWYENDTAGAVLEELTRRKVVFWRPWLPLENFGTETPTVQIGRWRDKDLLIDCPDPAIADAHARYGRENEEYEVRIIREGEDVAAALSAILPAGGDR